MERLWGARLVNAAQSNDVEELRQVCALIRAQESAAKTWEELPPAMQTAIRIALERKSQEMLSILIHDEKHAQFAQQVLGELSLDTIPVPHLGLGRSPTPAELAAQPSNMP